MNFDVKITKPAQGSAASAPKRFASWRSLGQSDRVVSAVVGENSMAWPGLSGVLCSGCWLPTSVYVPDIPVRSIQLTNPR